MHRLFAIAAVMLALLLAAAAWEGAHAHDVEQAVAAHDHDSGKLHDPADHSHPPGEDMGHQLLFHAGVDCPPFVAQEAPLALTCIRLPAAFFDDAISGITLPPPLRPPLR